MIGPGLGSPAIQDGDNTCICFGADQTACSLLQLNQHLGCRIAPHEAHDIAELLFLKLHHLAPGREWQPNNDHRRQDISSTINALPHAARCKQHTIAALLELVDGQFIATAHTNQWILIQTICHLFIDIAQCAVRCEQNCGMTVGCFHQLHNPIRDCLDIGFVIAGGQRQIVRDIQSCILSVVKG